MELFVHYKKLLGHREDKFPLLVMRPWSWSSSEMYRYCRRYYGRDFRHTSRSMNTAFICLATLMHTYTSPLLPRSPDSPCKTQITTLHKILPETVTMKDSIHVHSQSLTNDIRKKRNHLVFFNMGPAFNLFLVKKIIHIYPAFFVSRTIQVTCVCETCMYQWKVCKWRRYIQVCRGSQADHLCPSHPATQISTRSSIASLTHAEKRDGNVSLQF